MKKIPQRFYIRLLAAFCALSMNVLQVHADTNDEITHILKDRIDLAKKGVGIVVGIIDDKGPRVVSYGKTIKNSERNVDGDSVFEVGSVTKVFTATLLADMVARGEVKLNDPVSKYLPTSVKVPTRNGKEITLLDLATQSSGLPRMPDNFTPKDMENPYADYSVEQMYAFLSGYTLTRDIGAQYEYSNLGVGLLGHVLALRAGSDYETLVRTRILQAVGMSHSGIKLKADMQAHLATGHNTMLQPVANWDIPTLAGAGALRSTMNDMLKFASTNLVVNQSPLSAAMQATHQARHNTSIPNMDIGLAWNILKKNETEIVWHNGGTGGYHSFIGLDIKNQRAVVVLSNSANDIDDIGLHLLDHRFPLSKIVAPKQHTEIKLDTSIFDAYVGQYQLAPDFILSVTREGEMFFTQATGQQKFQLFAETKTNFFLKVVDAQISFQKNEQGHVTALTLHQGGRDMQAKKMD